MGSELEAKINSLISITNDEANKLAIEGLLLFESENPELNSDELQTFYVDELARTVKRHPLMEEKTEKNYGITKKFLNNLTNNQIIEVYRGLNNINLTHELLSNLNPTEIIALAYGTHFMKKYTNTDIYGDVKKSKYSEFRSEPIRKIINTVYSGNNGIRKLERFVGKKPHEHNSADLKKRLRNNIPITALELTSKSLFQPYRLSSVEAKGGVQNAAYQEGFGEDNFNKRRYINDIFSIIKNLYSTGTKNPKWFISSNPILIYESSTIIQ